MSKLPKIMYRFFSWLCQMGLTKCLVCLTKNREYLPCKNREKPSRDLLALNNKPKTTQSIVGMVTRQDCQIRLLGKEACYCNTNSSVKWEGFYTVPNLSSFSKETKKVLFFLGRGSRNSWKTGCLWGICVYCTLLNVWMNILFNITSFEILGSSRWKSQLY